MADEAALLRVKNLTRVFGYGRGQVVAVDDVSFEVGRNSIISFVGQSGSGKTTVARALLALLRPTSGSIYYEGRDITSFSRRERLQYWQNVQGIFQDPYASFNQFFTVKKILEDCYKLFSTQPPEEEKENKMREALEAVDLNPDDVLNKFPFEMSGGQQQRIMIARTFILRPKVLIADEPTSMIDACSRANILQMLLNLKESQGTSIIFITHDMGFAYYVSDLMYIMENGKIVERGSVEEVVDNPSHPYTRNLISDVPKLSEEWV